MKIYHIIYIYIYISHGWYGARGVWKPHPLEISTKVTEAHPHSQHFTSSQGCWKTGDSSTVSQTVQENYWLKKQWKNRCCGFVALFPKSGFVVQILRDLHPFVPSCCRKISPPVNEVVLGKGPPLKSDVVVDGRTKPGTQKKHSRKKTSPNGGEK